MVVQGISVVYGATITHDEAIKLFAADYKCNCNPTLSGHCYCKEDCLIDLERHNVSGEIRFYPFPHDDCDDREAGRCDKLYVLGIELVDFWLQGRTYGRKPQTGTTLSEFIAADTQFTKELADSNFGVFLQSRAQGVDAKMLLIKENCHCCS